MKDTVIRLEGVAHTLADSQLRVPIYQRSYAWRDEHVRDLLTDLAEAIAGGQQEYFLGSIVIAQDRDVVDGQQRLATVSILIAAIRDHFKTHGDDKRATLIEEKYLFERALRDMETRPRLILNHADHDVYMSIIVGKDPADAAIDLPTKQSHSNLRAAAAVAREHVNRLAAVAESATDVLVKWLDYLRDDVHVILFRVADDADAFTIFETLNDRGLELATSDLLKNHLFGLADTRLDEVRARWTEMTGALEAVEGEELLVTYIRHLWMSRHGLTRVKDLYKRIKDAIRTKEDALEFSTDLLAGAKMYAAVLSPDSRAWDEWGGEEARGHMRTLNELGMKQLRPLLLAILRRFPRAEIAAALNALVSAAARLIVVGGLGGGTLEEHYSSAARAIEEHSIRNAGQLRMSLGGIVPNDAEFQERFELATFSKAILARYYLRVLELVAGGDQEPAFVPNPDASKVNLEHILPEKPGPNWPNMDDQVKSHGNRLGNLALTRKRFNSEMRSAAFSQKVTFYREEEFLLTKEIADYQEWTKDAIASRQRRLAQLAVRAWPF